MVYYIAPQIWAWGARRLRLIKRVVNRIIVILPFEESIYQRAGVPCSFVGHPLLDTIAPSYNTQVLREQFDVSKAELVVGIVPGSREHEVRNFLPIMLDAARTVVEHFSRNQTCDCSVFIYPNGRHSGICEGVWVRGQGHSQSPQ